LLGEYKSTDNCDDDNNQYCNNYIFVHLNHRLIINIIEDFIMGFVRF